MDKEDQRVIYFKDELNDEFCDKVAIEKTIDKSYVYIKKNPFWHIGRFILYRLIATPLAWLYLKIKFHHKIENKKVLKQAKKSGYYLYGNHTQELADALIPSMVSYPKQSFVVVNPSNLAIKGIGKVAPILGALPLPSDIASTKNFLEALKYHGDKRHSIVIYPEAHIWPYYTKIRPFRSASFRYPIKNDLPVYCFTNTYQKRRGKTPKIVTYVDGPFYPNKDLPYKDMEQDLRDRVYHAMCERSRQSTVEVIKYIRMNDDDNGE
ncbi:MAG: hypothetical protein E7351_00150 [Clostridiales bacterium]|nr:hypothetical protein [Clostridiales bacterium]